MIIDFHTHVYPDRLADATVKKLAEAASIEAAGNGKKEGLLREMEEDGVDFSIVLPVLTAPRHFDTVNAVARAMNESADRDRLCSFAGIHPENDHLKQRIRDIKEQGFLGIKLHPDYQGTYFDDPAFVTIVEAAEEEGLITMVHAGFDAGLRTNPHCTPGMSLNLINKVHPKRLVLAHVGGYLAWDEVEELLVGTDAYMDLSYCLREIPVEQVRRIIRNHGVEKILFGTDWPWMRAGECLRLLEALDLTESEKTAILSGNAMHLLGRV